MAKNWGDVSEGKSTPKSNRSDAEEFFDKVDTTQGEMSAMSGSLQMMLANAQRAAATQAAAATPSVGMGPGSSSSESSREDETE